MNKILAVRRERRMKTIKDFMKHFKNNLLPQPTTKAVGTIPKALLLKLNEQLTEALLSLVRAVIPVVNVSKSSKRCSFDYQMHNLCANINNNGRLFI